MTKVYVVCQGWDYEGESIEGVFSTKELAQEFVDHRKLNDYGPSGYWEIYEFEVDAP